MNCYKLLYLIEYFNKQDYCDCYFIRFIYSLYSNYTINIPCGNFLNSPLKINS